MPGLRKLGKPLPQLGSSKKQAKPESSRSKQAKLNIQRSVSYARIEKEVDEAIARLSNEWKRLIPAAATLPERICALVFSWLGWTFQAQQNEDGGRLRIGGSVVDFKVWQGTTIIIVRVQGDYWHSLPDRKLKDLMQWERLHQRGYKVADLWEGALYQAWVDGRIKQFVRDGVMNAS